MVDKPRKFLGAMMLFNADNNSSWVTTAI